jgi:hypothetical protein
MGGEDKEPSMVTRKRATDAHWREEEETTKLLCGTTESMTKEGALLASCSQLLISRVFA